MVVTARYRERSQLDFFPQAPWSRRLVVNV
jgi:hypothetical protein